MPAAGKGMGHAGTHSRATSFSFPGACGLGFAREEPKGRNRALDMRLVGNRRVGDRRRGWRTEHYPISWCNGTLGTKGLARTQEEASVSKACTARSEVRACD